MSLIIPTRRGFISGIAALVAAPAIVRAQNIMPVRSIERLIAPPKQSHSILDGYVDEVNHTIREDGGLTTRIVVSAGLIWPLNDETVAFDVPYRDAADVRELVKPVSFQEIGTRRLLAVPQVNRAEFTIYGDRGLLVNVGDRVRLTDDAVAIPPR